MGVPFDRFMIIGVEFLYVGISLGRHSGVVVV
jgi:hypothetical protein